MMNVGTSIKLIIGLGNPGTEYQATRHNAGAWFIEQLAKQQSITLKTEKKFHGLYYRLKENHHDCHLLIPTTFMNLSGRAVASVSQYFDISADEILVCHDELDLPVGEIKIKLGGGHGGHNGLKDIINALGTPNFYRLRIGIAHPGHKDKVLNYVLGVPGKSDLQKINSSIEKALSIVPELLQGQVAKAMQYLHTKEEK